MTSESLRTVRDRFSEFIDRVQRHQDEAIAVAVIEFVTGPMLDNPRRVGVPLRNELEGVWSARRGAYRVLYRIDEEAREVIVLRVGHRRDVYRP
jgi:mRNA-degrading endonuclease RelE of RelBE toxin-antitoxin system